MNVKIKVFRLAVLISLILFSQNSFSQPLYPFGISGGPGGLEFKDDNIRNNSRIGSITIRHGERIDAISVNMLDVTSGRRLSVFRHGGNGGRATTIELDRDEYITKIEGKYGSRVDGFRITTNLRRTQWFGGNGGHSHFVYEAPPGYEIAGFCGKSGDEIDAIGVLIRSRNTEQLNSK